MQNLSGGLAEPPQMASQTGFRVGGKMVSESAKTQSSSYYLVDWDLGVALFARFVDPSL